VPVPIFIAAGGPMVAKFAGRAGDGMICTSGKEVELYTEKLLPGVAAGLAESVQSKRPFERMIEVKVSFDPDPDRAREATRHWAALALSPEEKLSVDDPLDMERLADALPLERTVRRFIVSSDADAHVNEIMKYVGMGFDHLVFHAPGPDQSRFLDLYASHVLPRLRARCG
jgi:coenzyme F420-dependent glucose-6-phosphate dehydrogenase